MAALEVDLAKVEMGQTVTVKWRGKPVFVRRRTEAEIDGARAVDLGQLRDPERDEDRAKNPEVRLRRAQLGVGCSRCIICKLMSSSVPVPSVWLSAKRCARDDAPERRRSMIPLEVAVCTGRHSVLCRSGWWWWASARTWAACLCPTRATTTAGSVRATAATTTHPVACGRGRRPTTWKSQSTSSWMTARCKSAEVPHQRHRASSCFAGYLGDCVAVTSRSVGTLHLLLLLLAA